ncbi:MAG: glycosyltransferase family 4 protein [Bacteroidetes bacterium HGW-Bacteroidetes-6]|nr:MAG: glycosyltransferase family 4 protein [Bacteroidetes bacterium HGW-Bacteroidetes-6]
MYICSVMKKILLLSDINSAHTKKWAAVLANKGFAVGIFSLSQANDNWFEKAGIELLSESGFSNGKFHQTQAKKISYINRRKAVRKAIKQFQPDILHAHYASSYGLLGAMAKFHPYFISVWGSDVLLFPSNPLNKAILRFNFRKADKIVVSSHTLAQACRKFTRKKTQIIPFGVDTNLFATSDRSNRNNICIGTVKSLEKVYGIDLLIETFAQLVSQFPQQNISLTIVGDGTQKENFIQLAQHLGISDKIQFMAPVSQTELVKIYHSFDIAVFLSRSESFGVSVLEASATALPVVVSKTGGLTEVVDDKITGFQVESGNINDAAARIAQLISDHQLRLQMGMNGRRKVVDEYEISQTISTICNLYSEDVQ